jgi:hypothetical protein
MAQWRRPTLGIIFRVRTPWAVNIFITFGFKINTLLCNLAQIGLFIRLRRPPTLGTDHTFQKYRIFRGNFTFSSMETETRGEPSDNWTFLYFAKGPYNQGYYF